MATDEATRRFGHAIFDSMPRESPSIFRKDFWNGKIMDWSMRDEAFKIEMFRFVDVFPVLNTPEQVARHLQEYFCRPDQDFPTWIQLGLKSVSAGSFVAKTAASQIDKNIRAMAAGFVAGETAARALPKLTRMRREQLAFTVDLLGEATVSEAEADAYLDRYLELIGTLTDAAHGWDEDPLLDRDDRGPIPAANISVKISSLFSQIDPLDFDGSIAGVEKRLVPIFERARARGAFVNLDVEQYALKDLTLALFRHVFTLDELAGFDHGGVVIQAYLRDSLEDTRRLCAWARESGIRPIVRLVKGAYWDYETIHAQQQGWPIPVYQNKWETDANYEACARLVLENHDVVGLAIASHNVRSIASALADAEELGVPTSGLELQMLYGMAEPLKHSLRSMGYRVRDYVPIGELVPGMAYLVRRLLENTSNEGFLRARFHDDVDPESLLRRPASTGDDVPDPTPDSPFANEPVTDFSRSDRRVAFADALETVRAQLGRHYPLVIGGERVNTERAIFSYDPGDTTTVVGSTACAATEDAHRAIQAAYAALPSWRDRPQAERSDALRRAADALRARRDELAALMVIEVGKSWREADADVAEAIDFCRYYADEAEAIGGGSLRLGRYPGESNELFYQPLGVGTVIAPWNFPLAILTGMTMAAVVTGNCVVIKPAEQSPVTGACLFEILEHAGLPPGVVNFVPGFGEEVGAYLVEHPWTRFVAFTGSREVGLHILRRAYDTRPEQPGVKRVICEMGGKNAIIVDDDADLDEAVAAVVYSAFGFQGQKCSACSRVIVLPDNHDAFVGRLLEAVSSLQIGHPSNPAFVFGPVIDADAATKVRKYVEIGHSEGKTLLVRDDLPDGGHFIPFAVFGDIETKHRLAQEEIFGPVLAIMPARDFNHAIEIANATSYALTGGIISRSPINIDRARRELRVGNLYINRGCTGALVYRQPFGGFKYSGLGYKAGGPSYLRQFVEERTISENTMRRGFAPET